jgi:drug/metabolite transporter (DMT)-like permease
MASYTVNDVLVKHILLQDYPVGETIFIRGVMSSVLLGVLALALGNARELKAAIGAPLAWRSIGDGLSTVCFIAALAHMKLANVAAVLQVGPLLITVLSVMLYREIVGWRRWSAIGIGFAGALMVVKPVPSAFDVWALVAVASALTAAIREILTRRIGHGVPAIIVAFWGGCGITLCGAFFLVIEDWRMFAIGDLLELFVAAFFVGIAIYLLAIAFRDADLSVVAPFRYAYLLTSAIGGFLMFSEWPDHWTVVGAALIVGSGIYSLHREAVRHRNLTAEATTAL